jgi:hypothetical protein
MRMIFAAFARPPGQCEKNLASSKDTRVKYDPKIFLIRRRPG